PKKLFRIRMSRNFGMKMLTMTNLSTECLIQLTKLGYDATPFNQILKQNAKREMRLRLGKVTCMFSCLQILEAFLWFVLITLLNVTLIILTLSVSRLLNLLLRLVAFLLFLNPQCLASISRWITASSS